MGAPAWQGPFAPLGTRTGQNFMFGVQAALDCAIRRDDPVCKPGSGSHSGMQRCR